MPSHGFINVFDPTEGRSDDDLLSAALWAIDDDPSPVVFWVSRVATLGSSPPPIPASVTLTFAPGASLVVHKRLVIRGVIDAGLESRFQLVGDGVVDLLGPLDEIVAQWWFESGGRSPVELALQALWTRYEAAEAGAALLPAPIRLDGPYTLTATLRIVPPASLSGRVDVVLRGQHGRAADPPTFALGVVPPERQLNSMVSVEEGVVLSLENVAFDAVPPRGGAPALSCLSLEGTFHGTRVEGCSFRSQGSGIQVLPAFQRWEAERVARGWTLGAARVRRDFEVVALTTSRRNRLQVSRCLFTSVPYAPERFALLPDRDLARGIDIGLGAPTALALRDSQFVGVFANAVAILGGELDITACQFANESTNVRGYTAGAATADILVRRWGDEYWALDYKSAPKAWPNVWPGFEAGAGPDIHTGTPLANTHVTITHCVSTSPIFLVMYPSFSYDDVIPGGALLTGVRHTPSLPRYRSVVLGYGMTTRSLILQGCWFGEAVQVDVTAPAGVVVDLGTRFGLRPGFILSNPERLVEASAPYVISLATLGPDPRGEVIRRP